LLRGEANFQVVSLMLTPPSALDPMTASSLSSEPRCKGHRLPDGHSGKPAIHALGESEKITCTLRCRPPAPLATRERRACPLRYVRSEQQRLRAAARGAAPKCAGYFFAPPHSLGREFDRNLRHVFALMPGGGQFVLAGHALALSPGNGRRAVRGPPGDLVDPHLSGK
jgi:hypothetical protein